MEIVTTTLISRAIFHELRIPAIMYFTKSIKFIPTNINETQSCCYWELLYYDTTFVKKSTGEVGGGGLFLTTPSVMSKFTTWHWSVSHMLSNIPSISICYMQNNFEFWTHTNFRQHLLFWDTVTHHPSGPQAQVWWK